MNHRINKGMAALFFAALGVFLVWSAIHRPKVLVVQSYATDYAWTRDMDQAIRKVLQEKPYEVKYHYMDTKNHDDPDFKRVAGNLVRRKIDEWEPDVLILADDNAQTLVGICYLNPEGRDIEGMRGVKRAANGLYGRCYKEHPGIRLVFTGVGATTEDYGYDGQWNVTGILERMDLEALREALLFIAQKRGKSDLRVHAPIDNSTSGFYNQDSLRMLRDRMAADGIAVTPQAIDTFDQWQAMVESTNREDDLLLFSNYHTVKCGSGPKAGQVKPAELLAWTGENSRLPALGAWGFFVEDGGMAAVGVSPYEQGEVAANMAVEIIDEGVMPSAVDLKVTSQAIIYLRDAPLRHFGLELPRVYENFARATGNFFPCQDRRNRCAADLAKMRRQQERPTAPTPCAHGGA